ncbi:MAG: carbohydrate kinase family protein [Pyrinomonadaceae bacterium]
MQTAPQAIVGVGELLWDVLPGGRQLGGAPANFACTISVLGDDGVIASRVGTDTLGDEALRRLQSRGVDTSHVQRDEERLTGTVQVRVGADGQPDFTIAEGAAWDQLVWTPQWESLAARADAICFGTLAQRAPAARATIQRFLRATHPKSLRVFDVNLRQDFYTTEIIAESLRAATVVKLNHEELPRVAGMLELGGRGEHAIANSLIQVFDLKLVCITRGARGSLLVSEDEMVEHPGVPVAVADTVGAGDAFMAALVYHFLRGAGLEKMSAAANSIGSWVASQPGATPVLPASVLDSVREDDETR